MTPLSRHIPFYFGAAAGIAGLALGWWLAPKVALIIAANAFFLVYTGITLSGLGNLTPQYLRKHAASSDAPAWAIFLVTLGTVSVAMGSLFLIINGSPAPDATELVFALAAVPLGWFTIHLMAAIHYAHLYWQPEAAGAKQPRGGLEFPGTEKPEGLDFLYFACVIGMTAQTSDVQITGRHMRKFNLLHAVVSFFFNTVLVAAAVNLAVSLGN